MRMLRNLWQGRRLLLGVGAALVAGLLAVGATAALASPGEQGGADEVHLQLDPIPAGARRVYARRQVGGHGQAHRRQGRLR